MEAQKVHLYKREYACLVEALRRRVRFNDDPPASITTQWTGLGMHTEYRQAEDHGYMEVATAHNPGYLTWWKLTPLGAAVVTCWLGLGFSPRNTKHAHGSPVNKDGEPPPRDLCIKEGEE